MRPINKDSLPHLLYCGVNLFRTYSDTLLCRIIARWWSVDIGSGCKFYGISRFRRHPGSSIHIGDHCNFASASWYNPVGINRKCMIATIAEHAVIKIGQDCGFSGTVIASAEKIHIGNRVRFGANTTITDTDWHPVGETERRFLKPARQSPVTIGNDVWLGLNVTVLKGVTIGNGTVVGANSVVNRDLPNNILAAGVPARMRKKLHHERKPTN